MSAADGDDSTAVVVSRDSVTLDEALGTGCFGTVYRGTLGGTKDVAVKVINPSASGYTLLLVALSQSSSTSCCPEEARMMMEFDHPNVVSCLKYLLRPTWIVMELCAMNLNTFFARNGWRMTEGERLDVLGQVNEGLVVVHGKGVVHRDIKASNVMVKSSSLHKYGVVYKIGDFGLASLECDNANDVEFRAYCKFRAPELKDGKCTTKVDMWNLGLIFYSLHVKGRIVQTGKEEISREEIDRFLREVSGDRIRSILRSLLDKDAEGRMDSECLERHLREVDDDSSRRERTKCLFSSLERPLCTFNNRRILDGAENQSVFREMLFVFVLSPFLRLLREDRRRRGRRRWLTETIYMSFLMLLSLLAFIIFAFFESPRP